MQRSLVALVTGLLLLLCGGTASAMADDPAVQAAGQLAASAQDAEADATSTQQHPTNQTIDVRIFSPGGSGSVTQANSSAAKALAGNLNATTQGLTQAQGSGGTQAAEQAAGNQQTADADATSTQVKPQNTRISVRVGSPGDDGDVSQSNSSTATGIAGNVNQADQHATQQGGGCCRGSDATQAAGQKALSRQSADADATSTQVEPKNTAISVRIGSPGDDGDVSQSNSSTATGIAANRDRTTQEATQVLGQAACGCLEPLREGRSRSSGPSVQAAGQFAVNQQHADADADSTQVEPRNGSSALRIDSGGRGRGELGQANDASAYALALNLNRLSQALRQQEGSGAPT